MVAGGLAAEADLAAAAAGGADRQGHHRLHAGVAFIEEIGHQGRIPVQPEGELGEVVRTDREAIETFGEGACADHVAGQFAHHVHLQPVLAPHQAVVRHGRQHPVPLLRCAAEGHHRDRVGESHRLPHPQQGLALQGEGGGEGGRAVAGGAAPAQHRVLLLRFEAAAAEQTGVLIALEIREAQDHRCRMEGRRDPRHSLGKGVDVVLGRIRVGGREPGDGLALLG